MPRNHLIIIFCLIMIHLQLISCGTTRNYLDPEGPKFSGSFATDSPAPRDSIKVVSFNIEFAKRIDDAIYELSQYEALQNADIILLQEMDARGAEAIAKTMGYNFVYYPASISIKTDRNFGNAILAKWPIKEDRKIVLPYENPRTKQRRSAVAATIVVDKYEIIVYSVHTEIFWLKLEKRISQADSIIKSIPPDAKYVIVGGDLNTASGKSLAATTALFEAAGFTWATAGIGYTSKAAFLGVTLKRLSEDYIFTKGMTVLAVSKLKESKASDHLPIWARLKIKEN